MIERRRALRHEIAAGELALLPSAMTVQVLDISLGGALLQASQAPLVGSAGRLTLALKGRPFSAEIEVRRVERVADVQPAEGRAFYKLGVMFADISPEHRRTVEAFTCQRSG